MQNKCLSCESVFIGEGSYCRNCIRKGRAIKHKETILPPSPPVGKKVGIIITTMNQWNYTKSCLESLRQCTNYPIDTIILDGASTDGTPDKVRTQFHHVTVIELDRPYWISYAWNRALEYGLDNGYDYIGILNNDITFKDDWLSHILDCFSDPNVGYAGPIQLNSRGVIREMGKNRMGYCDGTFTWEGLHKVPVGWLPGACIILRREAVMDVGMFDESFFFGDDEVDYCVRLWLNGWKVISTSYSRITHHVSKTITAHGGKEGKRNEEFREQYGIEYKNPKQRFYEKWNTDILDAIYATVKPEQSTLQSKGERFTQIWTPSL